MEPYDLFGEIPVTWPEIWNYVKETIGLEPDSPRAHYYVQWWNVAEKIRAQKIRTAPHEPDTPRR